MQDFSIKLPSTSSTDFTVSLNQVVDADAQQRFDLELLKMFGAGNIPHFQPPPDLYQHHHIPHTSQQVAQENLAMLANVPKLDDNNAYFDTFSPEKSGKRAKKRAAPSSAHEAQPNNGPYKCRDCEKTFRQKHGLNQHLLTHETNGAFECDGCGKRYSRQESVYRHQRVRKISNKRVIGGLGSQKVRPSILFFFFGYGKLRKFFKKVGGLETQIIEKKLGHHLLLIRFL